jgi:hypothetical protein
VFLVIGGVAGGVSVIGAASAFRRVKQDALGSDCQYASVMTATLGIICVLVEDEPTAKVADSLHEKYAVTSANISNWWLVSAHSKYTSR